jgi:hypothetical protein
MVRLLYVVTIVSLSQGLTEMYLPQSTVVPIIDDTEHQDDHQDDQFSDFLNEHIFSNEFPLYVNPEDITPRSPASTSLHHQPLSASFPSLFPYRSQGLDADCTGVC